MAWLLISIILIMVILMRVESPRFDEDRKMNSLVRHSIQRECKPAPRRHSRWNQYI